MALAGDHHVVVAIETQLDRALELRGGQCGDAGEQRGLAFLAAEAPAHATHLDDNLVRRLVEAVGHHVLHLGRVLGRAPQLQAAVLAGRAVGHLALEVELLLTAHRPLALQPMRRRGQLLRRLAADPAHRRQHEGFRRAGRAWIELGRQHFVVNHRAARGAAGDIDAGGNHREHRLADVMHFTVGKNGIVVDDRAAVVAARNIRRGEHRHHARHRGHGSEIDAADACVGLCRQAKRGMQGAGQLRDVVDIGRLAGHVQVGGLVRGAGAGANDRICVVHGAHLKPVGTR